jgi:hypothetical protein
VRARRRAAGRRAPQRDARLPDRDEGRGHAGARAGPTLSYGLSKGTILHFSTRARVDFGRTILPRSYDYLYLKPGRLVVGTVFRRQPVAIKRRSASGRWSSPTPATKAG